MSRYAGLLRSSVTIATLALFAPMVHAGIMTFTSPFPTPAPDNHAIDLAAAMPVEAQFLGTLSSYGTETYNEIPNSETGFTASQNLTFGASGITAVAEFSGVFDVPPGDSVSGNGLVEDPNTESGKNDITLSTAVTAFGTYIDQAGDKLADTLSLLLQNTTSDYSETVLIGTVGPNANFNGIFYFGVTDTTAFNKITLQLTNDDDGIILDNTTAGFVAVPEPNGFALLSVAAMVGLATCFFCRRQAGTARQH